MGVRSGGRRREGEAEEITKKKICGEKIERSERGAISEGWQGEYHFGYSHVLSNE